MIVFQMEGMMNSQACTTYPFFAGPVGAVKLHYGEKYDDLTYNAIMLKTCVENGIAAFTGDGANPDVVIQAARAIAEVGGQGIPTIKPWNLDTIKEKMELCKQAGCFAVAMDIDAAGLPLKAKEAVAAAIVVSNHGGRVLDQCPATAEVLAEIADALKGSDVKILIDGGIRSGTDIFKALAMGADGVLVCRPFVTAAYGGGAEGIKTYIEKLAGELKDTMSMCGAGSLAEITRDMVRT